MIKQIRYFQSVVRCKSFTEAAEQCFISQSAISQQIPVFDRLKDCASVFGSLCC